MSTDRKSSNGKGTSQSDVSSDFNSANPTAALNVQRGGKRFAQDIIAQADTGSPSDYENEKSSKQRVADVQRFLGENPSYSKKGGKTYKGEDPHQKHKGTATGREKYIQASSVYAHGKGKGGREKEESKQPRKGK